MGPKSRCAHAGQSLDVQIALFNKKEIYTTNDVIKGVAKITSSVDVRFDKIEIELTGTARTYNDCNISAAMTSGRTEASHPFLRLSQPDLQHQYPLGLIFEEGRSYEFPFCFAVPQKLLSHVCQHVTHNTTEHDCHLQLPPSLGRDAVEHGTKDLDDMAPLMANVRYETIVRVTELRNESDGVHQRLIGLKSESLHIIPAIQREPALGVGIGKSDYIRREEKLIRRGMFKGRLGMLAMQAAPLESLPTRLVETTESDTKPVAIVSLRFDPYDDNSLPPALRDLSVKLQATTHFATNTRNALPFHDGRVSDLSQGSYRQQFTLSTGTTAEMKWERRVAGEERSESTSEPSACYRGGSYYTARILIPIVSPSDKMLLPTFHSCLISRVYSLMLKLDLDGTHTGLKLKVPIQVSSKQPGDHDLIVQETVQWNDLINHKGASTFCDSMPPAYLQDDWTAGTGCKKGLPPHYFDIHRISGSLKPGLLVPM